MGGRREVSIIFYRPVTRSKKGRFSVGVCQHLCNWLQHNFWHNLSSQALFSPIFRKIALVCWHICTFIQFKFAEQNCHLLIMQPNRAQCYRQIDVTKSIFSLQEVTQDYLHRTQCMRISNSVNQLKMASACWLLIVVRQ